MQVVETSSQLHNVRTTFFSGSMGLVPTMGALHEGHLALIERARAENDHVGVSIFVNPTQFSSAADLAAYPRVLEQDLLMLRTAGVDLVWTPNAEEVYPPHFQTWIDVTEISLPLEGVHRPGHFRAVATVVAKLFNAFTPNRAYFGQKDAQQVAVIQRMVTDLTFPIEVIVCATVREADGLALSSRNRRLSAVERAAATVLYQALSAAASAYVAGERHGDRLRAIMAEVLTSEPLARPDYVSAADPETLQEVAHVEAGVLLSLAVYIGEVRLIDNILLSK